MNPTLLGILIYIGAQLGLGFWVSRNLRTEQDYLLAGRRLGYGISIFTLFATWFGAESCIGAAGAIYDEGLAASASDPFGYALCLVGMGLLFAKALHSRGLTTLADLYRERFSPATERVAVLLIVPTSLLWAAAQVRAFGHVIAATSGLDPLWATSFAAGAVIAYTVSGGLLADAVTDVFQGVVLIGGLAVMLFAVAEASGGFAPSLQRVELDRLRWMGEGSFPTLVERWAIPVCGSLFAQELVARVLAAKSPVVAQRSLVVASGLYVAIGMIPVYIGLVGPSILPGLRDSEQLLPAMAARVLPTVGNVLFAGALVSAILSTVDSALLVASSLVSHNIVAQARPGMTEAAKVRAARVGVVLFGIVAYLLALGSDGVHELVQQASGFGSAGIFVITIVGLYTTFGDGKSAVTALLAGVLVWSFGAYYAEWSLPFLSSLAAAALSYAVVASIGWWRQVRTSGSFSRP